MIKKSYIVLFILLQSIYSSSSVYMTKDGMQGMASSILETGDYYNPSNNTPFVSQSLKNSYMTESVDYDCEVYKRNNESMIKERFKILENLSCVDKKAFIFELKKLNTFMRDGETISFDSLEKEGKFNAQAKNLICAISPEQLYIHKNISFMPPMPATLENLNIYKEAVGEVLSQVRSIELWLLNYNVLIKSLDKSNFLMKCEIKVESNLKGTTKKTLEYLWFKPGVLDKNESSMSLDYKIKTYMKRQYL